MDRREQDRLVNARTAPRTNPIWWLAAIGGLFILLAIGGSFFTSNEMNKTADNHSMSSGRTGDAQPNTIQEQQNDKSARGLSTTGANPNNNVPPASR